jgi:Rac GTPase-activating protein 1
MPLARRYKKPHLFKGQVILNSESCAHCDKRTKFGKMIMKCRECDIVVHNECKDLLQRPCYQISHFPVQGLISDYVITNENEATPHIPPIIQIVINEIEAKGLSAHEVGLYRVNGSDMQIKQLKDKLIKRHQLPDLRKVSDIHVLCSFVKDFLNNLSEHLITYDSWYRFAKACDIQNETERICTLQQAIEDLPTANRDTLSFVILHLQRISETPEIKMPITNLARVFGPSIVGNSMPNMPPADIINELKVQHQIVENLIRLPSNFYSVFVDYGFNNNINKLNGQNDNNSDSPSNQQLINNNQQLQQAPGSGSSQRLFKNQPKTPELMRKSKTAVVLSSFLGPAANIPPTPNGNNNYRSSARTTRQTPQK